MADRAAAVELVAFSAPKIGSPESEWEDGAGYDRGDPCRGRPARLIVVDGATEAYDAIRWVGQLVGSFVGLEGSAPVLDGAGLDAWFGLMQQRWAETPREFASIFEEHKFHESGSFATFLGCEVRGLGGPEPHWVGAALGDAVLFQVRGDMVVEQFPQLAADGFGTTPEGVFTRPSERDRMRAAVEMASARLQLGDHLLLATDGLAQWIVRASGADDPHWRELVSVEHPQTFRDVVDDLRRAGAMKNDDVTLLRAQITPADAGVLVVCS
ncbi:hypothetical protein [Pseudonocardia sp.]|uniref:hypothetical protein n=1 Tax=Pseudonocardia sp. TaxID=60912 RepID=UPI003D0A9EFD